jgi:hypothetical protein
MENDTITGRATRWRRHARQLGPRKRHLRRRDGTPGARSAPPLVSAPHWETGVLIGPYEVTYDVCRGYHDERVIVQP